MLENFITAFVIYFVVVDPVGTAPIFLAVTANLDKRRKARVAVEGTAIAGLIMMFFAICGSWILGYLKISPGAFKIAGGLILFVVALDMLMSKRQERKEQSSLPEEANNTAQSSEAANLAIFPLAIPLLAGPASIMSVMVVSADLGASWTLQMTGYGALVSVMVVTGLILSFTVVVERFIDPRATSIFSRVTAIILAGLSVQYVVDGLTAIGAIAA